MLLLMIYYSSIFIVHNKFVTIQILSRVGVLNYGICITKICVFISMYPDLLLGDMTQCCLSAGRWQTANGVVATSRWRAGFVKVTKYLAESRKKFLKFWDRTKNFTNLYRHKIVLWCLPNNISFCMLCDFGYDWGLWETTDKEIPRGTDKF